MTLVSRTYLTEDEEYDPAGRVGEEVEALLKGLKMDTYNKRYVVSVTVLEVDERGPTAETEEDDDNGS